MSDIREAGIVQGEQQTIYNVLCVTKAIKFCTYFVLGQSYLVKIRSQSFYLPLDPGLVREARACKF